MMVLPKLFILAFLVMSLTITTTALKIQAQIKGKTSRGNGFKCSLLDSKGKTSSHPVLEYTHYAEVDTKCLDSRNLLSPITTIYNYFNKKMGEDKHVVTSKELASWRNDDPEYKIVDVVSASDQKSVTVYLELIEAERR